MSSSRRLYAGAIIPLLVFAGLVIAFFRSRKGLTTSEIDQEIQSQLTKAGYDPFTAKMWAAVARHESNVYESELAKNAHNLFGMKVPTQRQTTAMGNYTIGNNVYAKFSSEADSVRDLLLYLAARRYPMRFDSVSDLTAFMKSKGYFEATLPSYTAAVQARLNQM